VAQTSFVPQRSSDVPEDNPAAVLRRGQQPRGEVPQTSSFVPLRVSATHPAPPAPVVVSRRSDTQPGHDDDDVDESTDYDDDEEENADVSDDNAQVCIICRAVN